MNVITKQACALGCLGILSLDRRERERERNCVLPKITFKKLQVSYQRIRNPYLAFQARKQMVAASLVNQLLRLLRESLPAAFLSHA